MFVPGSNLLNSALSVIASQSLNYFKFNGVILNEIGMEVTQYEEPIIIWGSFQPIARDLYQQYGLDLSKSYYNFYTSNNVIGVGRDVSGDQVSFENKRYQCESITEWFGIDGWVAIRVISLNN